MTFKYDEFLKYTRMEKSIEGRLAVSTGGYPAKGSELSNEEAGASKAKRINSVGRYSPCLRV